METSTLKSIPNNDNYLAKNSPLTVSNVFKTKLYAYITGSDILNITYINILLTLTGINESTNPTLPLPGINEKYIIWNNVLYINIDSTFQHYGSLLYQHVNLGQSDRFLINNKLYEIDGKLYIDSNKTFVYFDKLTKVYSIGVTDSNGDFSNINPNSFYTFPDPPHNILGNKRYPQLLKIYGGIQNYHNFVNFPIDIFNNTLLNYHNNVISYNNDAITINTNNFITDDNYYINGTTPTINSNIPAYQKEESNLNIGDLFICLDGIHVRNYNNAWNVSKYL